MSLKTNICTNNCCKYKVIPYFYDFKNFKNTNLDNKIIKKAGSFIYDETKNKVLLVQSRGQMWGCPKGSLKEKETTIECATREVKEETGLDIDFKELKESVIIDNKVEYFIHEMKEKEVYIQSNNDSEANDANGIGWFHVDCLDDLIKNGIININQNCRILIKKILRKNLCFNKK
jgi:ADP-ribose pyrophosphatase YjhB (NUDIX family)